MYKLQRRDYRRIVLMDDLDYLKEILDASVARNGEQQLTNKWLLNIVLKAIDYKKHTLDQDNQRGIIEENRFNIY
jgi:hypothetical protein